MRIALAACLAVLVAAAPALARPDVSATVAMKKAPKLTCKRAKHLHVKKLGKRMRKRVLAKRRSCAKAHHAPSGTTAPAPAAPTGGAPTPAAPTATATPDPGGGDTVPPLPPDNPHALQVVSGEYFLNLSKGQVSAGDVRVEFNNAFAEDPHDLHLVSPDGQTDYAFGELQSGEISARTVDLSKGSWSLFCSLPEHAQRGMKATLKVVSG
jgi:plastocyanin